MYEYSYLFCIYLSGLIIQMISRFLPAFNKQLIKYAKPIRYRYINNFPQRLSLLSNNYTPFSGQTSSDRILLEKADLIIRNSETFQLQFVTQKSDNQYEGLSVVFEATKNLGELKELLATQYNIPNANFYDEQGVQISESTPLQALMNQYFILFNGTSKTRIEGQLHKVMVHEKKNKKAKELKQNLEQLQFPVFVQREIEAYIQRINIWMQAKYGPQSKNPKLKIKAKEIQDILVQAILDPQCKWKSLSLIEEQWQNKYWQVIKLREKKDLALKECTKMAKNKMFMGVGLIAANIGFIWSGTYVFYSWDIIQPIAYFTSSLANIIIFGHVIKLRQSFSLENYKAYLIDKYMPKACEKLGLSLHDLQEKEMQLSIIEATLKDHLIAKL